MQLDSGSNVWKNLSFLYSAYSLYLVITVLEAIPEDEGVETHQVVDQSFIGSIRGFSSTVKPPIKGVYLYTLNICINMFMFYYGYKLWRKRPFMLHFPP